MEVDALPYDDEAGEKFAKEHPELDFKSRIGSGRLYLLSESSAATNGRSRQTRPEEAVEEEVEPMSVEDTAKGVRDNAILFRGDAIANLPTQRIFRYVSHCGTPPLGLEWVDDTNVVLVWSTVSEARNAYKSMREAGTLEIPEDDEGFVPARPVPETLAPMEMRLEKALGKNIQDQAQMWMRWARAEDVKQRGNRAKSKFYEKYGENAGKEGQNMNVSRRPEKRRRENREEDLRRKLDAELDTFAEGDEASYRRSISPRRGRSASPPPRGHNGPSRGGRRKRSDYDYDSDLQSRLGPKIAPSNRSVREWDIGKEWETDEFGRATFGDSANATAADDGYGSRRDGRGNRRDRKEGAGGRDVRPSLTKEELDAELDAFLAS